MPRGFARLAAAGFFAAGTGRFFCSLAAARFSDFLLTRPNFDPIMGTLVEMGEKPPKYACRARKIPRKALFPSGPAPPQTPWADAAQFGRQPARKLSSHHGAAEVFFLL
jgi:hypothetical protein